LRSDVRELPHASMQVRQAKSPRESSSTSLRELHRAHHCNRVTSRCLVPSVSQIRYREVYYGTLFPLSIISAQLHSARLPPLSVHFTNPRSVTDISTGRYHGASPGTKSTVTANAYDTSTASSRRLIMHSRARARA
jgi:hypothetical protein